MGVAIEGEGRCDPLSGICAVDPTRFPDKIIKDPRPLSNSPGEDAFVPVGFQRMCRACEGASEIDHLSQLSSRCWAEVSSAMNAYGLRVDVGSAEQCTSELATLGSFNQAQC